MIWMSLRLEPGPEPALEPEQQHEHQARDHRRHRERQVDQRDEEALAAELELGDRPGGRDPDQRVERHRHRRGGERERDRRPGVGMPQRGKVGRDSLGERLGEDGDQRQEQDGAEERQADRDQQPTHQRRLAQRRQAGTRRQHGRAQGGGGRRHQEWAPAMRSRPQACNRLMTRSSANDRTSMAAPIAVAPR